MTLGSKTTLFTVAITAIFLTIGCGRNGEPEPNTRIVCLSSAPNAPQTLALWDVKEGEQPGIGEQQGIIKVNGAEVILNTGDTVEVIEPLQEISVQQMKAKEEEENALPMKFIKVKVTFQEQNSSSVVEGWAQDNYIFSAQTCPSASGS